jgi:hypothetical protein
MAVVNEDVTWIHAVVVVFQGRIPRALNEMNPCQQKWHKRRALAHELVWRMAHPLVQVGGREGFDRTGGDHACPSRPGAQQRMGHRIHLDTGTAVAQEIFCGHAVKYLGRALNQTKNDRGTVQCKAGTVPPGWSVDYGSRCRDETGVGCKCRGGRKRHKRMNSF